MIQWNEWMNCMNVKNEWINEMIERNKWINDSKK